MIAIEWAYQRFCRERFPLPTESNIADLEGRIGVSLPDDYREFILDFNGGYFTEPDIVPPSDECPTDCLTCMRGIGATFPGAELARPRDLALFDDNDPPQIVPVGYTMMGGLIILVTHPNERGRILYKEAFGGSYFLAHGIEEFFELLHEPTAD